MDNRESRRVFLERTAALGASLTALGLSATPSAQVTGTTTSLSQPARELIAVLGLRYPIVQAALSGAGGPELADETQQLHVQRTQNAGHPLSGADSFAPIAQLSGRSSELSPLASKVKTVSTATNSVRRIPVDRTPRAPAASLARRPL